MTVQRALSPRLALDFFKQHCRTAPEDSERHLHYWMGQQQRKLGHNELSKDQADKLESLLQTTKGKKAEGVRKGGGSGGSRKRDSTGPSQQQIEGAAAAGDDLDAAGDDIAADHDLPEPGDE